jgi:hypothetical protein
MARTDEEKKEIYDKWHDLINMSQKELEDWGEDPDHLEASLNRQEAKDNGKIQSGYDSFHRIKRRKDKPLKDWSNEDFDNASQENGFNSRMLGGKPGDVVGSTGMSKWEISLRNWGHDPSKPNSPQHAKWKAWQKQHEDDIKQSLEKKKMKKKACIVAAGNWEGERILFKTRDRNYQVPISFHHEFRNGVEILYFKDEFTGWCEGMNEFGIGVVNATLTVDIDVSRMENSSTRDASIILRALEQRTVEAAADAICKHRNGLHGHTIVSDANTTYSIEHFEGAEPVCKVVDVSNDMFVRTNHGLDIPEAGYQKSKDPKDRKSSVLRRLRALRALRSTESKAEIIENIFGYRPQDHHDPMNTVRSADHQGGLNTVAQYTMDLQNKEFNFYAYPYKHRFQGYFSNVKRPKITLHLFRCRRTGEGEDFEINEVDLDSNKFTRVIKASSGLQGSEELFNNHIMGDKKAAVQSAIQLYKTNPEFRKRLN